MLGMGAWECDLLTQELDWTPGTFALFGIAPGTPVRREEILGQYEKRSRERLEAVRAAAIRDSSGFSLEVDIIRRDGIASRLRIDAEVETSNGTPTRIYGIKQQVRRSALAR